MTKLAAAFDLFRRGLFVESRGAALEIIGDEPQNFWAYYLAAVSSAFQSDLREFEKYLGELDNFETKNIYLHYLKAYYSLLQRDIEKALWHYLEIANDTEGWLARSLVKKFRKIKELKDIESRVADFIVLPAELPPPTPPMGLRPSASAPLLKERGRSVAEGVRQSWRFDAEKKQPRPRLATIPYRKIFILLSLAFVAVCLAIVIRQNLKEQKTYAIPDLQVADSAAVMPVTDAAKILFEYKSRQGIINDFELARQQLAARKINQSRYLLNRLLYSNADFQTREKSRVFLGFIPDPDFTDFNDNLTLKNLFENVKLRTGSVVVASGELRDSADEAGGILYQFIARENGEEYRVHAFKNGNIKEEKYQSASAAPGSRTDSSAHGAQIQVYGRFKGLIGSQKAIYLEILRVWR